MPPYNNGDTEDHETATERDEHTARGDQPVRESSVPPHLTQLFEYSESKQSVPKALDVFQPADWPPCPACDDRLIPTAVTTDAYDALVAAVMICYNSEHTTRRYVYDVVTETVYFDQVLADPGTEPTNG